MLICSTIQALDETRRPRVKVTGLLAIYILCMVHCYFDTLTLPSLCLSLLYLPPFLTFPSYLHSPSFLPPSFSLFSSSFILPLSFLLPSPSSSSFLLPLFFLLHSPSFLPPSLLLPSFLPPSLFPPLSSIWPILPLSLPFFLSIPSQIALLCGAPGLGKTTLAHIIAKHAGYNVVEMNAR